MIRHYSCCTSVNNQAKFIETIFILQINWPYSGKNKGEYREEFYFTNTPLCKLDSNTVHYILD